MARFAAKSLPAGLDIHPQTPGIGSALPPAGCPAGAGAWTDDLRGPCPPAAPLS